jgi:RNA polymerase sigma factor (sigma-70 family)
MKYPTQVRRKLNKDPLAELDLEHEAILKMNAKPQPQGVDPDACFQQIFNSLKIDRFRRERRKSTLSEDSVTRGEADNPVFALITNEDHRLLHDAIQKLDASHRIVLLDYYFEKRTLKEIASTRGCRPQSVSTLLNRALHSLKKLLSGLGTNNGQPA